jgi:hypothetical protein
VGGEGGLRVDTRVEQVASDNQDTGSGGGLDRGRQLAGGSQLPCRRIFSKMQVREYDDPTTHRDV